jgi:hypothetical protein
MSSLKKGPRRDDGFSRASELSFFRRDFPTIITSNIYTKGISGLDPEPGLKNSLLPSETNSIRVPSTHFKSLTCINNDVRLYLIQY